MQIVCCPGLRHLSLRFLPENNRKVNLCYQSIGTYWETCKHVRQLLRNLLLVDALMHCIADALQNIRYLSLGYETIITLVFDNLSNLANFQSEVWDVGGF